MRMVCERWCGSKPHLLTHQHVNLGAMKKQEAIHIESLVGFCDEPLHLIHLL